MMRRLQLLSVSIHTRFSPDSHPRLTPHPSLLSLSPVSDFTFTVTPCRRPPRSTNARVSAASLAPSRPSLTPSPLSPPSLACLRLDLHGDAMPSSAALHKRPSLSSGSHPLSPASHPLSPLSPPSLACLRLDLHGDAMPSSAALHKRPSLQRVLPPLTRLSPPLAPLTPVSRLSQT